MSKQSPSGRYPADAEKWEALDATMAARAALRHIPLGATFELTPFCNLRCKMCYVRLDKHQADGIGAPLTAVQWIQLADEAIAAGTLNLMLTGGEPLLRPDFPEIYLALTERPFILSLNTNATLMDAEFQALFRKRPPSSVAVTLYGAGPETYQRICGDAGAFERTIQGLELLRDVPTNLEVRTTFIQDNMYELDAIREIANRYTERFAINVSVYKPVRGATAEVEACRLTPAQALDIDEANLLYYRNASAGREKPAAKERVEGRKRKYDGFDLPPQILSCTAAKSMYWISWDGRMLPCGSFSHPYTRPLEEGFLSAWERLPSLLDDVKLPVQCEGCQYNILGCPNCPANTQMETGGFSEVAPYLCALAREKQRRWQGRRDTLTHVVLPKSTEEKGEPDR